MKVFILFFLTIIPFSFNNLYSEYSSTDYALAIQKERDILKNLRKSHQNLYRSLIKNKFKLKKLNKTIQAFTENKTMFWNIEDFISINKNIFNNSNESLSNKKNNIKKSLKIINNILNYFKLVEQNKDTNNFEIAKKESEIIKINNEIKDFEFTIKNLEKKIKKSLENIENKKNEVIDFRNSESHKKSMKLFLTNEDIKIKKSKILLKTTKNELYKKVENKNLRKSDLKNLRLKVKLKKKNISGF